MSPLVFPQCTSPRIFNPLIRKGNKGFSTMIQQGTKWFFAHTMKVLGQQANKCKRQCMQYKRVRHFGEEHDDLSMSVLDSEVGKDAEEKVLFHRVDLRAGCGAEACTVVTYPDIHVVYSTKLLNVSGVSTKHDTPINDVTLPWDKYLASGLHPSQRPPPHELRIHFQSTHSSVKMAPGQIPSSQVHVAQRAARAFWALHPPYTDRNGRCSADEGSLFFNDEKVAKAERGTMRELKALAHLYAHAPHQLLFQAFRNPVAYLLICTLFVYPSRTIVRHL
ncbi:hypothetical protein BU17DRAFT_100280 [Hysterangium stoloniferum]|nr:hypothetical protein BU17DRAFT_100280 [Hysterangium stoloniferum]